MVYVIDPWKVVTTYKVMKKWKCPIDTCKLNMTFNTISSCAKFSNSRKDNLMVRTRTDKTDDKNHIVFNFQNQLDKFCPWLQSYFGTNWFHFEWAFISSALLYGGQSNVRQNRIVNYQTVEGKNLDLTGLFVFGWHVWMNVLVICLQKVFTVQ